MNDYWQKKGSIHEPMAETQFIKTGDIRERLSKFKERAKAFIRAHVQLQKMEVRLAYNTQNEAEISYLIKFLDSELKGDLMYIQFKITSPKGQTWLSKLVKASKKDIEFTIKDTILSAIEKVELGIESVPIEDIGNPQFIVQFAFDKNKDGSIREYQGNLIIKKEIILKEARKIQQTIEFGSQTTQIEVEPNSPKEPIPPEESQTNNIENVFDEIDNME